MKTFFLIIALSVSLPGLAQIQTAGNPYLPCIFQEQSQWCWAACIQMVLNNAGIPVTQSQIVYRLYGDQINDDATSQQMANVLSGQALDFSGYPRTIYCQVGVNNNHEVLQTLSLNWPLIAGISNQSGTGYHAVVISAADYYFDVYQQPVITAVYIKDPLYGSSHQVSMQEFMSISDGMVLKVWVQ